MEVTTHSPEETNKLAKQLATKIKAGAVIALYGDLGAGKTTFTRFLTQAIGISARVQSPTFVIARKYQPQHTRSAIKKINHLDLYRLSSESELKDLDLNQFFDDLSAITIIEWPELAEKQLPKKSIKIRFEYVDENSRKIYVENMY